MYNYANGNVFYQVNAYTFCRPIKSSNYMMRFIIIKRCTNSALSGNSLVKSTVCNLSY